MAIYPGDNPFDEYTAQDPGVVQPPGPPGAAMQFGPPQTPEEMQQRVSGWDQFLGALQKPEIYNSLLQAGAQMMQPGTTGQRFGRGAAAFGETMGKEQQRATENQFRQEAINETKARTGIAREQLGISKEELGMRSKESTARLAAFAEELKVAQRANDPAMIQAATDKIQAEIDNLKAQAEAHRGQAEYYKEGGAAGANQPGNVQLFDREVQAYRDTHPGVTESQAVLEVTRQMRSSKGATKLAVIDDYVNAQLTAWKSDISKMNTAPPIEQFYAEGEAKADLYEKNGLLGPSATSPGPGGGGGGGGAEVMPPQQMGGFPQGTAQPQAGMNAFAQLAAPPPTSPTAPPSSAGPQQYPTGRKTASPMAIQNFWIARDAAKTPQARKQLEDSWKRQYTTLPARP